ncbi:hypothetical protein [Streptomyces sp. NPDC101393]|uniref:NAD-dependent epimerase/dehydratase family protein n=1 Tax=Streptomyces sp. NPDC101393 TaxID=3366141 RepID=UPI0038002CB7
MTRYRLSGAVMTHPKRLAAAEDLARAAPPGALRVVMDPDPGGKPSVLRTALSAWSAIEDGATHQLVVQDDMILSDAFFDRARLAIEEMPDAALALFALWDSRNGAAVRFGAMAGARWVGAVNEYFPCVAIILPRQVASGFVDYGRRRLDAWPDDILMYRYLRANGIPSYVSVPNLAEHEDHGSISGNAFRGPRRSACFLPDGAPGRAGGLLTGLTVLPFFKHGVAQCAVRVEDPGPRRWLHLNCEQYLEGSGVRVERYLSANLRMSEAVTSRDAKGAWLTAFTMGFVHRRKAHRCDPSDAGGGAPDPAVLAEAMATVGPGGISYAQSEDHITEVREELARITESAAEAGMAAAARPGAARSAVRPIRVGVRGSATPVGEHLLRGLADRGHQVTVLNPARGTAPPADTPALDALIDLSSLSGSGGQPGAPSGGGIAVDIRAGSVGAGTHDLYVGDLYGPGCSPYSRIGRMVWDALRSQPLTIDGSPGDLLSPLHISDLADALSLILRVPPEHRALSLVGGNAYTVAEMAEAVRKAVRPVPLAGGQSVPADAPRRRPEAAADRPAPPGWEPTTGLIYGLHTFAQWLAYEGGQLVPDV